MKRTFLCCVAALVTLSCSLGSFGAPAAAADLPPVEVPVILPLTGPAANIGQELQKSMGLAEKFVNDTGGIRKQPLHFTFLDDQGQPQVAVQLMN